MYEVSQEWITGITAQSRDIRAKIVAADDLVLTDEAEIITIQIERACNTESRFFGNAIASKMEVSLYESENTALLSEGKMVQVVFMRNEMMSEQVPMTPMRIQKIGRDPDAGTVQFTAYDALYEADAYKADRIQQITYPISLSAYAAEAAAVFGVTLSNTAWYHADLQLRKPPNLSGTETIKEVVAWIAQAAFCNAVIDREGKLSFADMRKNSASPYIIDADQYYECEIGAESGPYNTLVLARLPQEDNIYREDGEAVLRDGRKEIKIADNPFLDHMRDDVIDEMFAQIKGARFYAMYMDWRSNPALDMGDPITISDTNGHSYRTFYGAETLEYDGGLRCTGKTLALTETETAYRKASDIKETVRRTELAVDKVKGEITAVVEQTDKTAGDVDQMKQELAALSVTVDGVSAQTQHRGGANLLHGTAAFSLEDFLTEGTVSLSRDGEYAADVRHYSAAGGGFVLEGAASLSQTADTIPGGQYCFMLRYKLLGSGAAAGTVIAGGTETELPPVSEWTQIKGNLTASGTAVDFAVECTAGTLIVADLILMPGLEVSDWQQAQNEILTEQMTFSGGVLSIGASGEKLSTRIDNASFAVKNNASGKYEAFFDENGAQFGKTSVRGTLTIEPASKQKGLVLSSVGDGHNLFTVND